MAARAATRLESQRTPIRCSGRAPGSRSTVSRMTMGFYVTDAPSQSLAYGISVPIARLILNPPVWYVLPFVRCLCTWRGQKLICIFGACLAGFVGSVNDAKRARTPCMTRPTFSSSFQDPFTDRSSSSPHYPGCMSSTSTSNHGMPKNSSQLSCLAPTGTRSRQDLQAARSTPATRKASCTSIHA